MEAWLVKELDQRRQSRSLTALARETDIAAPRLQRIARGEADPAPEELAALLKTLRPAAPKRPASKAPAVVPAAAPAPKPAVIAPSPKPAGSAPVSSELAMLRVPAQGPAADFLHRKHLIEFALTIRDWPQKHTALRPGDMARLQLLWNETQTAISAVNVRIWGSPEGPGTPAGTGVGKKRKTHHSLRFLFKQAAEEKLPKTVIDELSRLAREGVEQGAAKGFLDSFVKSARAVLDDDDFKILLDKAVVGAGPKASADALLKELEDDGESAAE